MVDEQSFRYKYFRNVHMSTNMMTDTHWIVNQVNSPTGAVHELIERLEKLQGLKYIGSKPTKTGGTSTVKFSVPGTSKLLKFSCSSYTTKHEIMAKVVMAHLSSLDVHQNLLADSVRSSSHSTFHARSVMAAAVLERVGIADIILNGVDVAMKDPSRAAASTKHNISLQEVKARVAIRELMKLGVATERLVKIMQEEEINSVISC